MGIKGLNQFILGGQNNVIVLHYFGPLNFGVFVGFYGRCTSKFCDFEYSQPVIFATSPRSRNKGHVNYKGFTVFAVQNVTELWRVFSLPSSSCCSFF